MKIYDVAFLGMGASSLATLKLSYQNSSSSIVGIDKHYNSSRNNFFAFWLTDWMREFDEVIKHKWHYWEFNYDDLRVTHESKEMPYCVIKFQEWKSYCIKDFSNLIIKEKDVIELNKLDDCYEIKLDDGERIFSKKVYDSRTPTQQPNKLKQHFLGKVIRTDEIDYKDIVNLMDFRVSQDDGLHFMYVLPLSNNELLIESTVFSKNVLEKNWYENKIDGYIKNNLKINNYQLIEEERGILPMYFINNENDENYINIGSRGGATKVSSGYAFSFFLKKLKSSSLKTGQTYHSFWDNWMDRVFVSYLENNNRTDKIFKNMVNSLNGDEFASFMMGTSSLNTKIKIIYSMPKLGFIQSLFRSLSN